MCIIHWIIQKEAKGMNIVYFMCKRQGIVKKQARIWKSIVHFMCLIHLFSKQTKLYLYHIYWCV